jgi:hypothetical protein
MIVTLALHKQVLAVIFIFLLIGSFATRKKGE